MTRFLQTLLKASLIIAVTISFSACGQKGPLIVDQPATEQVTTQEEELEETK